MKTEDPNPVVELPPLGLYRHYKGRVFEVVGYATLLPSEETLVLHLPVGMPRPPFARTVADFTQTVDDGCGEQVPRFALALTPKEKDDAV